MQIQKKLKIKEVQNFVQYKNFTKNEMYKVLYISIFTLKIRSTMLCTF